MIQVEQSKVNQELMEMQKQGKIVVTPHVAGVSVEAQVKAARIALSLLMKHLQKGVCA